MSGFFVSGVAMGVTIRRATEADLDAVIDLRREVAAEGIWIAAEAPLDEEGDRRKHGETVRGMEAGEVVLLLVATDGDGAVVGSLYMGCPIGVAHLGMNVAAGHRGQGIGVGLLEAGLDWARSVGAHKAELEHWPWNHAARRLYERFGFIEEGYRRRQYRRRDGSLWDSVVMGLVLDHDAPGHDERPTEPPRHPGA